MSTFMNDRDMVAKIVVPDVVTPATNPSTGDVVGDCTHTVGVRKKGHVLGITITGSAAGYFILNINSINKYPLRVAENGMVKVMFYYNTFTASAGQVISVIAGADLTGQYEVCMEIYEESQTQ